MADQAHPVLLDIEAQLRLQWREHVLPHWVSRACVVQADLLVQQHRLELIEVSAGLLADRLLGPSRCERCPTRELLELKLAADAEIVVAGQANRGMPARELDARVRIGPVADEIAQ